MLAKFAKGNVVCVGLIDTHSHLQSKAFSEDLERCVSEAKSAGVASIVVCAGSAADWTRTREVAHRYGLAYMLGIHPLLVPQSHENDLLKLAEVVKVAIDDPHFIGIGEIGLEGLTMTIDERQEWFFREQLKLARLYGLPVSVHVRKSASRLLYHLRRKPVHGVIHAFNGSVVEREAFLKLGFKLGFGGAVTYDGSQRIRRHASELPADAWVLETDAPDMPSSERRDAGDLRTEPKDIARTLEVVAALRGMSMVAAQVESTNNALEAFPRLRACWPKVQ